MGKERDVCKAAQYQYSQPHTHPGPRQSETAASRPWCSSRSSGRRPALGAIRGAPRSIRDVL